MRKAGRWRALSVLVGESRENSGRLPLLAHQGVANQSIAEQLELSRPTVVALREPSRKTEGRRLLAFARGAGEAPVLTPELEQKIIETTCEDSPRRRQHAVECSHAGQGS